MTPSFSKLGFYLLTLCVSVSAWSGEILRYTSRKTFFRQLKHLATTTATTSTVAATIIHREAANAACLPGDLSPDCIGVYKVPINDAILPYVGTPEALEKFAPDLKFVPPTKSPDNFKQAIEILETQRLAAQDIRTVVQAGRLEEAGIKVLNLLPRVNTAGRLAMDTVQGRQSMVLGQASATSQPSAVEQVRLLKLDQMWEMVQCTWGETDVAIGQGLRGDMGVSAVAQIQILACLQDATRALDDFLAALPKE